MTHAKKPEFASILFLCISLMFAGKASLAGSTDKIYKWVDQNGAIQYTQFPPPSGIEVQEVRNAPPPADDPAAERARLEQDTEALDERMEARKEAAAKALEQDSCGKYAMMLVMKAIQTPIPSGSISSDCARFSESRLLAPYRTTPATSATRLTMKM